MDCLLLCDDIDCQQYKLEIIQEILSHGGKPKVILRQHLRQEIEASKNKQPFIIFNETTQKIEDWLQVLAFHRQNPAFSLIRDKSGIPLSVNPAKVEVTDTGLWSKDLNSIFTTEKGLSSNRLLPVDPPRILILAHNKHVYLELSLNSLLFSLGNNVSQVPTTLVLIAPTSEVVAVATKYMERYPSIEMLTLNDNVHIAAPTFVLNYLESIGKLPETFMVYEDDFILPTNVRDCYPNWPWWFGLRLKNEDLVAWLPAFDNCPTSIKQYMLQHNIQISRTFVSGSRWISSTNNFNIAAGGAALACKTELYRACAKRSSHGCPVDTELGSLASNISAPTLLGYHIGWNQEQDGFPNIATRKWPKVRKTTTITDCKSGITSQITL